MLRSKLFWRLFGSYILISGLAAIGIYFVMAWRRETQALSQLDRRLSETAAALQPAAGDVFSGSMPTDEFQRRAEELAAAFGGRITLINSQGLVLVDTQNDPRGLDNHLQRPEVQAAVRRGIGTSQRESATLGISMLYCARRVDSETELAGFVRTALPVATVDQFVAQQTAPLVGVVLGISVAGLVASYWVVSRILRPVAELQVAATSIAEGNAAAVPSFERKDELGRLADAFRRMSKQLDKRLLQLEQRANELSAVLEGMGDGIIAIDDRNHVLFVNGAAGRLFTLPDDNVRRRPLWELVRHPSVQNVVEESTTNQTRAQIEFETLDGALRKIELTVIPMPGEPCKGFVLGFHDVTELRRLEQLRSEFVANVSHELKTPLAAILACAETLRHGAIDDPSHRMEFVHSIERQGERLQQLILDLLSLARIEAGEEPLDVAPRNAKEAVEECVSHHAPQAEMRSISIELETIAPELAVMADSEGLRQILDNLIDNAVKYSQAGGTVAIRWNKSSDESAAVLEVEDTGLGISPADQSRIFERFYRADKARSRELGGTGLGLSIVKHLSQAFGGSVAVRSELGQGSVFIVTLPLHQVV
ncbi:MAG: ATP-binding protein [Pirellulales bacterium]|nr:ATP-binding protein [Pirellulales bacterium]